MLRENSTSPPPVLKTLQTPCCGASPTQTLQHCGWTAPPLCNSKKLSVKHVFSRRSCRSSKIAVEGEAQDRCSFRVNSSQLVLIHAFAFGQSTPFIQARSHYTVKFEAQHLKLRYIGRLPGGNARMLARLGRWALLHSDRLWAGSLHSRREPRSSNQSTDCGEVRHRWCPAGAFPLHELSVAPVCGQRGVPNTVVGQWLD